MIFAVTNQKGGVGKTTTVLNIGAYLSKKGKKVLLIDMDPQANLTSGLGLNEHTRREMKTKSIYDVLISKHTIKDATLKTKFDNLHLVPSGIELAGAEVEIVSAFSRETILKRALDKVSSEYDFILVDCPPSLGLLTINGLVAADGVLIPVQSEYFALEGLGQLINTVKLIKANLNNNLEIAGVIITMFDTRTNLSKDVKTEIENHFKGKLFNSVIPRNIKLSEAPSHGLSILEYAPTSLGAKAYDNLTDEIIQRFKN